MLVRRQVEFVVKRHPENERLYILLDGSKELLDGSNFGELGLEIPPQLTEEQAQEIASYLKAKLRGLSVTIPVPGSTT